MTPQEPEASRQFAADIAAHLKKSDWARPAAVPAAQEPQGLSQLLPSTFAAYAEPGETIDDPAANFRAAHGYIKDRYGSMTGHIGEMRPAAPVAQEPPAPTGCDHPRHVIPIGAHVCFCGTTGCCGDLEHAPGSAQEPAASQQFADDLAAHITDALNSAQEPADPPDEWIECGHLNPASAFPGESFCANRKGHAGNHNSRWGTTWPAPDRMQQLAQPMIVFGNLGWRNPTPPGNGTQFQVYGPGGRWAKGDSSIEDALIAAGAREGDRLIVIAVDRYADAAAVEAKIRGAL